MGDEERASHTGDENAQNNTCNEEHEVTFGFPILDLTQDVNVKNIPSSILPHFHVLVTDDPDAFLLELTFCVEVITTCKIPKS